VVCVGALAVWIRDLDLRGKKESDIYHNVRTNDKLVCLYAILNTERVQIQFARSNVIRN
jgi:hypothetical protein